MPLPEAPTKKPPASRIRMYVVEEKLGELHNVHLVEATSQGAAIKAVTQRFSAQPATAMETALLMSKGVKIINMAGQVVKQAVAAPAPALPPAGGLVTAEAVEPAGAN